MARKRMIDPSIWLDDGFAELSPTQQLLYIGLFSNADDEGRVKGSASALRLMLPAVYAGASLVDIDRDLAAVLGAMGKLRRYESDGKPYLVFLNYTQRQYIQRPSDSLLPSPQWGCESDTTTARDQSDSDHGMVSDAADSDHGGISPNRIEKNRKESNEHGMNDHASDPVEDSFSDWWRHYPRKINRKAALKAWKALKPDAAKAAMLIEAIERQTAAKYGAMVGTDREGYIPHASTWLNGEQWQNTVDPVRSVFPNGQVNHNAPFTGKVVY